MRQDDPTVGAEHRRAGVVGGQATEALGVHGAALAGWDGEQVGEFAGGQGTDEVQPAGCEVGEVVFAVLAGVEHHRRCLPWRACLASSSLGCVTAFWLLEQGAVAAGELVQDGAELGDVGTVPGVAVADDRDRAVAGHHESEADQA